MITTGDASVRVQQQRGAGLPLRPHPPGRAVEWAHQLIKQGHRHALARYIAIQGHCPAVSAEYLRHYPQCMPWRWRWSSGCFEVGLGIEHARTVVATSCLQHFVHLGDGISLRQMNHDGGGECVVQERLCEPRRRHCSGYVGDD